MIEWMVTEIADGTYKIKAKPACGHKIPDPGRTKHLEPREPQTRTEQRDVSRRTRRNRRRRAAHGPNPAPDDACPQILPLGCAVDRPGLVRPGEGFSTLTSLGASFFGHRRRPCHAPRETQQIEVADSIRTWITPL